MLTILGAILAIIAAIIPLIASIISSKDEKKKEQEKIDQESDNSDQLDTVVMRKELIQKNLEIERQKQASKDWGK